MDKYEREILESYEEDLVDMDEVKRLFKVASNAGREVAPMVDEAMIAMSMMEASPVIFRAMTPAQFVDSTADLRTKIIDRMKR